jgi:hypothetical protein
VKIYPRIEFRISRGSRSNHGLCGSNAHRPDRAISPGLPAQELATYWLASKREAIAISAVIA